MGKFGDGLFTKMDATQKEEKEKVATEAKALEFEDAVVYNASKEQ